MFFYENILITASRSGEIIVWNKETLKINRTWKLRPTLVEAACGVSGYLYEVCTLLLKEDAEQPTALLGCSLQASFLEKW